MNYPPPGHVPAGAELRAMFALLPLLVTLGSLTSGPVCAGEVVLEENFDGIADGELPPGWSTVSGKPRVEGGRLLINAMGEPTPVVYFGDPEWRDVRVEVSLTFEDAAEPTRWAALAWRTPADSTPSDFYMYTVRQNARARNGLEFARRMPATSRTMWRVYATARAPETMRPGEAHRLVVEARGNFVRHWFDGKLVVESPLAIGVEKGRLGFTCSGARAYFDNLKVSVLPPMTPEEQAAYTETGKAVVCAHRGFSAIAPENTLASYRAAIDVGAPAAECDVVGTSDGVVVLSHDWTADRCTDGSGKFSEMTLEQVKQLDAGSWKGEKFAGERVPTLKEALAVTKGKLRLVVEIKDAGVVEQVAADIREMDAINDCTIISFNLGVCKQMREIEPGLAVGWLTSGLGEDDEAEADKQIQMALSANVQFVDVASSGVKPALVRRANLAGLTVWVWTVNDPDLVKYFAKMGVKSITTDDPAMARSAAGYVGLWEVTEYHGFVHPMHSAG